MKLGFFSIKIFNLEFWLMVEMVLQIKNYIVWKPKKTKTRIKKDVNNILRRTPGFVYRITLKNKVIFFFFPNLFFQKTSGTRLVSTDVIIIIVFFFFGRTDFDGSDGGTRLSGETVFNSLPTDNSSLNSAATWAHDSGWLASAGCYCTAAAVMLAVRRWSRIGTYVRRAGALVFVSGNRKKNDESFSFFFFYALIFVCFIVF